MKKDTLKKMIKEEIKAILSEKNQPAIAPTKPGTKEKETMPGAPPTEKPRRTLRPEKPGVIPKTRPAKAMYEGEDQEIVNKIVQRFKKLK
jgi:hypothetical protein